MNRLPHGYTNETRSLDSERVLKRSVGPGAVERCRVECTCLHALDGLFPVARLIRAASYELELQRLSGRHGQELIDEGRAEAVLRAAGSILRRLHSLSLRGRVALDGHGEVLTHGDFGPQNLLLTDTGENVVAVLDWEWAHFGEPIEDLAWAEWIVRAHHPDSTTAILSLFEGYGERPKWIDRQATMAQRCEQLAALDHVAPGEASSAQLWRDRAAVVLSWSPLPDD